MRPSFCTPRAVVAAELHPETGKLRLCRQRTDDEPAGDVGVRQAGGDESQDLPFAVGEVR
jgi:hypothetical protein